MATILVVDDEIGVRELLAEILRDAGHRVLSAGDAAEAFRLRRKERVDLVLLDVWMPGEDGLALLRRWAAEEATDIPIVMLSGHATIDAAVEATRIGACAFLEKPIALQRLLSTVYGTLAAHSTQRALTQSPASTSASPARAAYAQPYGFELPIREAREAFERVYFANLLQNCGGSVTAAAQKAGLERTQLHRKLRQLGIRYEKKTA